MTISNSQNNANINGDSSKVFEFLFKHLKPNPARITLLSSRKYEAILSPTLDKFKTFEDLTISLDNQVQESERTELQRRYYKYDIFNMHQLPLVKQDLVVANPPFTQGEGGSKKEIYTSFLELAYKLLAKNGQALFILPTQALLYGHKANQKLSTLFNVKKVFFLKDNAGFEGVKSRLCAVILETLDETSKPSTEIWVDDTYVLTTNQYEMVAPLKGGLFEKDLTIALSVLYKVFNPNNLYQFDQAKKCKLSLWNGHAMNGDKLNSLIQYGAIPQKYAGYRLVPFITKEASTAPRGFANSKVEDFEQLSWYLTQSKVMGFISQMMGIYGNVYTATKACISKDWKMLTSDEIINEYYGFTNLEINYINECVNND